MPNMEESTLHLTAVVVQFPVTLSIPHNVALIQQALERTRPGNLVVFPEGAISGYGTDVSFLETIDHEALQHGLATLRQEARERDIVVCVGACIREQGQWVNAAFAFLPQGGVAVYHKINLATHERGTMTAGTRLPVFSVACGEDLVSLGFQLCRELRFPEQWGWLARQQAQIILHLNNAVGNATQAPVWRSHLISRAAETQRFVLSANNAATDQQSPTCIIAPDGNVVAEVLSDRLEMLQADLDLSCVSDWYLNQCRNDIVRIHPPE